MIASGVGFFFFGKEGDRGNLVEVIRFKFWLGFRIFIWENYCFSFFINYCWVVVRGIFNSFFRVLKKVFLVFKV